jgi:rubredoxin---NAD+ reductase
MGKKVVIIGTGLAGYGVTREFRKWDKTTPLTLITADDGVYYSKPKLSSALGEGKTPDQLVLKDAAAMAKELEAEILTGYNVVTADAVRKNLATGDGREIKYDKLVLAVGARTRKPAVLLEDGARIHSVNNLREYRDFRESLREGKRLIILGAGMIGCEFAHDFSRAGYTVTVVGKGSGPLTGLVPDGVSRALEYALSQLGVNWIFKQRLEGIRKARGKDSQSKGWEVLLRGGISLEADVFLSAIGFDPDLTLAEQLGLKTNRGISVDLSLRSSAPDIFALGDCAEVGGRWLPFVMSINLAARVLGQVLAGREAVVEFPLMPILIKTPSHPVAVLEPPCGTNGAWTEKVDASGVRAEFRDDQGRLSGFAVSGARYSERNELVKQVGREIAVPAS